MKHKKVLHSILSSPTAPFREEHVRSTLENILKEYRIPYFVDPIGNLVTGVSSQREYLKTIQSHSSTPLKIAVAHMDHPGFHGVRWLSSTKLSFEWLGGSPTKKLKGRKVWIGDHQGILGLGEIQSFSLHPSGRGMSEGTLKIIQWNPSASPPPEKTPASNLYGGFTFRAPFWKDRDLLYTQVADDLIGVFAIIYTLIQLHSKKSPPSSKRSFVGLLSRAEEVGFIGTLAHLEQEWLQKAIKKTKRPLIALSLETSRTLPGAEIGKGPVVRVGDRMNTFDPGLTFELTELAKKTLKDHFQKKRMDGGTCEGSATLAYNIPTMALSVPLGNYHNQSLEGGPDAGPPHSSAPEFVSLRDVEGLCKIIHAAATSPHFGKDPFSSLRKSFQKSVKESKTRLMRRVSD